jgi:hypothetical protein
MGSHRKQGSVRTGGIVPALIGLLVLWVIFRLILSALGAWPLLPGRVASIRYKDPQIDG